MAGKECKRLQNSKDNIRLVRKAVKGSPKAYGELIELHKEYLYRTAYLHLKNEAAALDAVGDCILKGFQSIKNLREPAYFKTWLTKILLNTIKSSYKKSIQTVSLDLVETVSKPADISTEEKIDLYNAIESLPEKHKTVIMLKYFNDLKISEIAYAMDIPEGSVKSYLSRAKQELSHFLKEDYTYAN